MPSKIITGLFAVLLLASCGGNGAPVAQSLEELDFPFSGESRMGSINGEPYRYFRYPSVQAALIDKAQVKADGSRVGDTEYHFVGPVRFYHLAKRIVIYMGHNEETIEAIERIFGQPFAGSF